MYACMCVCLWAAACTMAMVYMCEGQRQIAMISSLLPCGFLGLNSYRQVGQQESLAISPTGFHALCGTGLFV